MVDPTSAALGALSRPEIWRDGTPSFPDDGRRISLIARSSRLGAVLTAASLFVFAACGSGATPSPSASTAAQPSTAPASAPADSGAPAGSDSGAAPECVTGSITAAGSTALQPLVEKAGKDYAAACPGAAISVQGGGSGTGLTQVSQGAVNIGNSDVTAESKNITGLADHIVAKQGWLMVANNDVTGITSLSTQQMTDIWTGKTTNWKDVGGPDEPIVLILRPESSGTRATFKKIVLNGAAEATGQALTVDSSGAVADAVKGTPGSTSVLAFAYFAENQGQMVGFGLDGVQISVDTMKDGTYKLAAEGHMYTKGDATGLAKSFIDYILSPTVQNTTLPALHYAGVK
jgi:phosphate transport system substrate-binding protein